MKEDIVTMILRNEKILKIENWTFKKYFDFEIFRTFQKKIIFFHLKKLNIGDMPGLRFSDL